MPDESTPQSSQPLERRLATILCADVVGYSKMMASNEERTVRVFRGHREIFESLVNLHRGRIFNTAGDALLAEFNSAVEAVRCATEIQAALRTRNEHLASEEKMQFRIGINLGDVIVQGGDLLGDGVNVAARIQTATAPGGICISGSVYDQIQNKLSLDFKLLGQQTYKNIAKPVRTYTINEDAAVTTPARRTGWRVLAAITVSVLAIAGAGYWGYQQYDAHRAEQLRIDARLAAQMAEQKQATEQAQHAAEEAKREVQLQTQKLAAEEGKRSAQERTQLEQERKRIEAEKQAVEAAKRQAAEEGKRSAQERTQLEQERKRIEAEKQAAEATKRQAAEEWEKAKKSTTLAIAKRPSISAANEIQSDGRFIAYDNGTVLDTHTNLMWAAKDNGNDINWANAKSYCENYRGGGYTDWRRPTLDELAGLYDREVTGKNSYYLTNLIELTACCLWASEASGSGAAFFSFYSGSRGWDRPSSSNDDRALPVRSAKEAERQAAEAARKQAEASQRKASTAAEDAPKIATSHDGTYSGRLCNQLPSKPHCWPVTLVVRNGIAEGSWMQPTKKTATARGTVATNGLIRLNLSSWNQSGAPTKANLIGHIVDGAITASGQWRNGSGVTGDWKRTP